MKELNLKGLDTRSEEVQELMGAIPSWIQRRGITAIAIILIMAFCLCYIVKIHEQAEIELTAIEPKNTATIAAPRAGSISSILVQDNEHVSTGDTLLSFRSSSGEHIFMTAPVAGHVAYIGPVKTNAILSAGIELIRITDLSAKADRIYYGYTTPDIATSLSAGTPISINRTDTVTVSFIAQQPNSSGLHYVEVKSTDTPNISTHLTGTVTLSTESILHKLITNLKTKTEPPIQ